MKVLVVAPHMDDEVLGAGGAIARHVAQGDEVFVCIVAHRVYAHQFDGAKNDAEQACAVQAKAVLGYHDVTFLNLPDERLDACLQDVVIPLEERVEAIRPHVVYLPHRGDNHQDHRAVFQAAQVACRPIATSFLQRLVCYEVPSSTDQTPPILEAAFLPNGYVDIAPYLAQKLAALRCYRSEARPFPHPRSEEAVKRLAQRRGAESGFAAAEAFMILRDRWTSR